MEEGVENGDIMTSIADAASASSQLQDASVDADLFSYGDYTETVYDDDGDEDGGDDDGTAAAASVNNLLVVALAVVGGLAVLAACMVVREKRRAHHHGHRQVGLVQEAVVHEVQAFPVHDNYSLPGGHWMSGGGGGKGQVPAAVELVPLGHARGTDGGGLMGVQSAQLVVTPGEGQVAKL